MTDDSTSFADLRQVTVVLRDDDDMRIRKNRADAGPASSYRRLSFTRSSINARSGLRQCFAVCDSSCHIFINVPADAQVNTPLAKIVSLPICWRHLWRLGDLQSRFADDNINERQLFVCALTHI